VQALQWMAPDVILSDFSLPQFDGLRALDIAVAHAPETPFIFVSGTIGEERAIDALRRGAIDYVLKTNLSRLPAAVERALREVSLKAARSRIAAAAPHANLSDVEQHEFRDSALAQPDGIAR
jgi:DNA-binding NtrC family response regulator